MHHLFLSPHFDDAIGSCGGLICRLVKLGHSVQVLTAFGGIESEILSVPAKFLHRQWKLNRPVQHRRNEDGSACGKLGCESSYLDFPDAIYRLGSDGQPLYPTFKSLRGPIACEDQTIAERLAEAIRKRLSQSSSVYCPMAIGNHVDHVIARDCGRLLQAGGYRIGLYRDFSYDRRWNDHFDVAQLKRVDIVLSSYELSRKIAAFAEYKSQISDLFKNKAEMSSYFASIGSKESIFLPRQTSAQRGPNG